MILKIPDLSLDTRGLDLNFEVRDMRHKSPDLSLDTRDLDLNFEIRDMRHESPDLSLDTRDLNTKRPVNLHSLPMT